MNIYRGVGRRQVGSGIWSTIQRGFRPFLSKIANVLKPHAISAGKRALGVGTNIAMDAISGKMNKNQLKKVLKDEALKLRDEAKEKITSLKRKYVDDSPQEGSGIPYKRRRKSPTKKSKKSTRKNMVKKVHKRKAVKKSKGKGVKPKRKQYKRRSSVKSKKGRVTKRKRRSVSKKAVKDIFG